ncbi:hypothetical protein FO488_04680 [Geobacter sp. FeAm09]|uniref:hypothetical protein n=1 Tax=Geobacter sp. FeAm09 TaxID=2597769 RepID=UPI0011EED19B|nr:hypothetical protein [Geobacter sp. FeAm09]QEM67508.1 hypothetical protein FO488_04680 [Geobacter sp. FeAm09]
MILSLSGHLPSPHVGRPASRAVFFFARPGERERDKKGIILMAFWRRRLGSGKKFRPEINYFLQKKF